MCVQYLTYCKPDECVNMKLIVAYFCSLLTWLVLFALSVSVSVSLLLLPEMALSYYSLTKWRKFGPLLLEILKPSTRNVYEKTLMKPKIKGDWFLRTPMVLITAKILQRRQIKDSLYSEAATESYKVTDLL